MEELGGLIKKMPVTAVFVLGGALSVAAIVPFNGFISEWLTYQALFANIVPGQAVINIVSILSVAALAMVGTLAAASVVKLFGISFLGLPRSAHASVAKEVPGIMNVGTGILVALCLLVGLFPMFILKLLDGTVLSLTGTSILGQLEGGFLMAYYPLTVSGNSISPLALLIAVAAVILLVILVIRIIGGKYVERKYGTWDCGFEALTSKMQYSANGFSKPIKIVFKQLFRTSRETHVTGASMYHPESMDYSTTSESIFEKYIYRPLFKKVILFSKVVKFKVQTGNIHNYLLYMFFAILILMAYNRFA